MTILPKSLPRLCVALGCASVNELANTVEREYRDGSTFFEFRLDYLPDPQTGISLIEKIRRRHPEAIVLATCRHRRAHGKFAGTAKKQLEILRASVTAGAQLVDIEIESAEQLQADVAELQQRVPVIVSYHQFENTPALGAVFRRLYKIPADIYKVATTAKKPSDNLRVLDFARTHNGIPTVLFAMAETGLATRVLTPALGGLFTYAAPDGNAGTAPGQIGAHAMRALYRVDKLDKQSKIFGIIASPVAHSKSPYIHNRAFQAKRINAVYLPFLVGPSQLGDWMSFANDAPVCGFSVTLPHKRKILRYLDIVEPLARRIGAVNTVWKKAGKWRGANTDAIGVSKPLQKHLRLPNTSVLIAGYGGAARAAAIALADAGAHVAITGRDMRQAKALAAASKGEALGLEEAAKRDFDVLVHATPVGMTPKTDGCLFPGKVPGKIVLEMVYSPLETVLAKRARDQRCIVIPGTEMLLEQAIAQFEIWTGQAAPRDVMSSALEQHL